MYQPLIPCPGCARHVRAAEPACPFCDAALPTNAPRRAMPAQRLSRAAAFVFGATIAATGCSASVDNHGDSGTEDAVDSGTVALYGGPAPADAAPDTDSGDDGGLVAAYGGPFPVDAGPPDDGGGNADYGAPPPRDR